MNSWRNADNMITLINKQEEKIILNHNHNGRRIFIDDNDCEILDKNYINDKNNKISWRHIFSYLDKDSIERIMNDIQRFHMKTKVLNIRNHITFNNYSWEMRRIVEDIYDCHINYNEDNSERQRKREILEEECWEVVEWNERDDLEEHRRNVVCKNIDKIDKVMKEHDYIKQYDSIRYKCIFRKANGNMCGKSTNEKIRLTYNKRDDKKLESYTNLWIHELDCCGTHYNQYNKLKTQDKKYEKIEDTLLGIGYKERNGILCKVCR
jgi:ribosomal protein S8